MTGKINFFSKEENGYIKNWYSSNHDQSDLIFWELNSEVSLVRLIKKNEKNVENVIEFSNEDKNIKFYKTESSNKDPLKNTSELLVKGNVKNSDKFINEFITIYKDTIHVNHFLELLKIKKIIEQQCL